MYYRQQLSIKYMKLMYICMINRRECN